MKKIAIDQSSFLPWKGYFDIINSVDVFVFYDCVQFTKRDWRTRNYIKTPEGIKQITIPVRGSTTLLINQIKIAGTKWQRKIINAFKMNYGKAEFFKEYSFLLYEIFEKRQWEYLFELNQYSIIEISKVLGIKTEFIDSSILNLRGSKTDRLIDALIKLDAEYYLSGPSASSYIEKNKFDESNIKLEYIDYSRYPEYPQLWGDFSHTVSILDLIFNMGKKAPYYIWGWKK